MMLRFQSYTREQVEALFHRTARVPKEFFYLDDDGTDDAWIGLHRRLYGADLHYLTAERAKQLVGRKICVLRGQSTLDSMSVTQQDPENMLERVDDMLVLKVTPDPDVPSETNALIRVWGRRRPLLRPPYDCDGYDL